MRYITPHIILVGCDAGCFVNLSDVNDLLRLTVSHLVLIKAQSTASTSRLGNFAEFTRIAKSV